MNAIAHIVAQHINIPLLQATPHHPTKPAGPSAYVCKYGPQIADLKAKKLTNRQIAAELGLPFSSIATVYSRWIRRDA